MKDYILTQIWIYPIKSLGGIRLASAKVLQKGLVNDRRWMLLDEKNEFMTQRAHPKMALFQVSIENDRINVTKRNPTSDRPSISFSLYSPPLGRSIHTKIWDDEVDVLEVDPIISEWFSEHLGSSCKLVSFPEKNSRPVDARYQVNNEQVSLADAYPFLIIGQSSLDDLNTRLSSPVPINRFRPNFVFTGGDPYEEDTWKEFTIGKNRFIGTKPCARCVLTTVNQETAEKGSEPLYTLSTYRKRENKTYFGQNVIARDHGEIFEGDKIVLN